MADRRRTPFLDPWLVALLSAQRLIPIVALAIYLRGYRPLWLVAVGFAGWVITMLHAIRASAVAREARRRAVSDAAWGIARRSAARVRGGAHDGLLEIIWRGISARSALLSETMPSLAASLVALPIAFAVAIVIDGREVAAVAMLAAIVGIAVRVPLARRHQKAITVLNEAYSVMANDLGHGLRALEDLQAHGLAEAYAARLESHAVRLADADSAASRTGRAAMLGPLVAGSAVFVAVLSRTIDTPAVGLVHLATLLVLGPIALGLARGIVARTKQRSDAAALDRLAELESDLPLAPSPIGVSAMTPIVWSHVTFRHPAASTFVASASKPEPTLPNAAIFEDVTIRWEGTRPLAIVGPNGSGKSTLVMLLLRLADPSEGSVTIGGVDLRRADPAALRPRIAYVPQRPLLLEGMSVGEAMRLVAPDADDARLLAALERVGLAARLKQRALPPLEVPCSSLSVGEAQRVAIGRALARDAELLVLDEPEAGLDPSTRAELRTLLETLVAEGKRVVIASQHEDVVPEGARPLRLPLAPGSVWEGSSDAE